MVAMDYTDGSYRNTAWHESVLLIVALIVSSQQCRLSVMTSQCALDCREQQLMHNNDFLLYHMFAILFFYLSIPFS